MDVIIYELDHETAEAIFLIGWYLITAIGSYGIFRKANQVTSKAFIPIVNFVELCRLAGISGWWVAAVIVPGLNFIAAVFLSIRLTQRFGMSDFFGVCLGLSGFLLLPVLGFNSKHYHPRSTIKITKASENLAATGEKESKRSLLIAVSIFYGLIILSSPGLLIIGAMAFDAPGSNQNPGLWVAVVSVLSAPVTILIVLITSWTLYAKQRYQASIHMLLLPLLHIIGFIIGIVLAVAYEKGIL